ncbi:class I SAM-dependent methyltransferase [Novosphingobium pituita]|jgi:phospholipid N-methyltransferase|nr:methyltransferase domain-containing protein [Novosphingobium sp. IK01]MDK4807070.1 methyltransferase domain-containing protein [Novosphingobium aromaticivorans]HIQ16670.1 methyltransferase domain-containing protein [Novosphingobium capsulatum]
MNSTQAARAPLHQRVRRKAERMFGPAGIFFKGFVKNPVMVGAIVPSSRRTIEKVLSKVDWEHTDLFVEYGPGVGTFCQPVLDRLRRDARLLVIDTNPDFIAYLSRTIGDSRFIAVNGSAADVEAIVREHGYDHADYVLSGLPFSTLPEGVGPAIMAATHRVLRPGGAFLVYQYTARARALMSRYFHRIDKGFEPVNVPPCVISWGWKD